MNIREAILKAADWIEGHPEQFMFSAIGIPDCGSPGCALGWIGHFAGHEVSCAGFNYVASDTLKLQAERLNDYVPSEVISTSFTFYNRMEGVSGGNSWRSRAEECARALRLYADKYHPIATPDWEALARPEAVKVGT